MNSIGISIKNRCNFSKESLGDCSLQLHFNLWKSPPKGVRKPKVLFNLDIGIMAKFITDEIKIYLPYMLRDKEVWEDLGHIIINDRSILCALFNEDYDINPINTGCYYLVSPSQITSTTLSSNSHLPCNTAKLKRFIYDIFVKDVNSTLNNDTPPSFYVYTLGSDDIRIDKCKDAAGSLLTIKIPNQERFSVDKYFYIRFRVPIESYKGLALRADLSNNLIQSAFTNLDMYNIQINEQRDIPYGPKGILKSAGFYFAPFSKIHIFYLSSPKVTVETGSSKKSDVRIVDPSNWLAYIPDLYPVDTYVGHHWKLSLKNKPYFSKTNLFFTAKYPKFQTWTVLAYCSVVILLGSMGSVFASLFYGNVTLSSINKVGAYMLGGITFYVVIWYLLTHYTVKFSVRSKSTVRK